MPIKFLRFPALVQIAILRNIDLFEVIFLSTKNKRVKRVLDAYKYPIDMWSWYNTDMVELSVRNKTVLFKILPDGETMEPIDYSLNLNAGNIVLSVKTPEPENDLILLSVENIESAANTDKTEQSKLRLNELISRHLLKFIKPVCFDFMWRAQTSPENLFVFDLTNTFDSVHINPVNDTSFSVSTDFIKMLMENITAEEMNLNIQSTTEGYKYQNKSDQVSKVERIYLENSGFFQFENLIRYLTFPKFAFCMSSPEKINPILKEWIEENNNFMEFMFFYTIDAAEKLKEEEVLAEIPFTTTRFTPNQLISRMGRTTYDATENHLFDIRRTCDERVATVGILEDEFYFYVWTDEQLKNIQNILD